MSELVGFPMKTQLDGSINQYFDCVPTSVAAGLEWLTKQSFPGWQLKNSAYGADYTGGTAASAYVSFCDAHGVNLYARSGDCVAIAHEELAKGHPVLFTQQDDYSSNPDYTHVCVWYKDGFGGLTAMDPFGGFPLTYDDTTWRARMRANEVWIMARKDEDIPMIDINSPNVGTYFTETDASHWYCKQNKNTIAFGILGYYKRNNGLLMYGLPLTGETYPKPGVAVQLFERGAIVYDPQKQLDNPPGAGDCYPAHVNYGPAFDVYAKDLKAQIASLQSQIAAAQNTDASALKAQIDALTKKIEADKTTAQAVLTAVQNMLNQN